MLYQPYGPWTLPPGYVQGPIPISGVHSPPPPYYVPVAAPAVEPAPSPAVADKKVAKTKAANPWAPPKIDKGVNYMFDNESNHTRLHIFNKAAPVWVEKYRSIKLRFKMFKVSINFTIRMVIEETLKKSADDCGDWAVTETVEDGDGNWLKGTTIEYSGDKARGTLRSMGWSSKRGEGLPPVWLVVHKVGFQQ